MLRLKSFGTRLYNKWKEIGLDYKSAAQGTLEAAQQRPIRAFFYTGSAMLCYICYRKTPTEGSYTCALVESSHKLLLCTSERSPTTDDYIQGNLRLLYEGKLRYQHLGLFSIMYQSNHGKDTKLFKAECQYSNPQWHEFPSRIIDFGLLGIWWKMQYAMTDYDVDFNEIPKEYKNFFEEYLDIFKRLFGFSYFNYLIYKPLKRNMYVFTSGDENSDD